MSSSESVAPAQSGHPLSSLNPPQGLPVRTAWELLSTAAGVPVFVLDADGKVLFLNAISHIAFQVPEQPTGRTPCLEEVFDPPAAALFREELRALIGHEHSKAMSVTIRGRRFEITLVALEPAPQEPARTVVGIVQCPAAASVLVPSDCCSPGLPLSRRERQVLSMIGGGLRTEVMAERLGVSTKTIRNYVAGVARKLRVSTRLEMARIAHQLGVGEE